MTKLNEVTQRIDSENFDAYNSRTFLALKDQMTTEEIQGLKERLEVLEEKWANDDDMMENFDGVDEADELLRLRTLLSE